MFFSLKDLGIKGGILIPEFLIIPHTYRISTPNWSQSQKLFSLMNQFPKVLKPNLNQGFPKETFETQRPTPTNPRTFPPFPTGEGHLAAQRRGGPLGCQICGGPRCQRCSM